MHSEEIVHAKHTPFHYNEATQTFRRFLSPDAPILSLKLFCSCVRFSRKNRTGSCVCRFIKIVSVGTYFL